MGPEDLADPKPLQLSQLKAEAFKFCVVTKRLGQSKANYVAALQDAWAIAASTASALAEPGPGKQISAGQRLATAAIAEEAEEAVTPECAGTEVMSVPAPGSSTALVTDTSTAAAVLAVAAAPAEAAVSAEETEKRPAAEEAEEAAAAEGAEGAAPAPVAEEAGGEEAAPPPAAEGAEEAPPAAVAEETEMAPAAAAGEGGGSASAAKEASASKVEAAAAALGAKPVGLWALRTPRALETASPTAGPGLAVDDPRDGWVPWKPQAPPSLKSKTLIQLAPQDAVQTRTREEDASLFGSGTDGSGTDEAKDRVREEKERGQTDERRGGKGKDTKDKGKDTKDKADEDVTDEDQPLDKRRQTLSGMRSAAASTITTKDARTGKSKDVKRGTNRGKAVVKPTGTEHPDGTSNGSDVSSGSEADVDTCAVCGLKEDTSGVTQLLECAACKRGFHLACVSLEAVPNGYWACETCTSAREARDAAEMTRLTAGARGMRRNKRLGYTAEIAAVEYGTKRHRWAAGAGGARGDGPSSGDAQRRRQQRIEDDAATASQMRLQRRADEAATTLFGACWSPSQQDVSSMLDRLNAGSVSDGKSSRGMTEPKARASLVASWREMHVVPATSLFEAYEDEVPVPIGIGARPLIGDVPNRFWLLRHADPELFARPVLVAGVAVHVVARTVDRLLASRAAINRQREAVEEARADKMNSAAQSNTQRWEEYKKHREGSDGRKGRVVWYRNGAIVKNASLDEAKRDFTSGRATAALLDDNSGTMRVDVTDYRANAMGVKQSSVDAFARQDRKEAVAAWQKRMVEEKYGTPEATPWAKASWELYQASDDYKDLSAEEKVSNPLGGHVTLVVADGYKPIHSMLTGDWMKSGGMLSGQVPHELLSLAGLVIAKHERMPVTPFLTNKFRPVPPRTPCGQARPRAATATVSVVSL